MEDASSVSETNIKAKSVVDVGGVEGTLTAGQLTACFRLHFLLAPIGLTWTLMIFVSFSSESAQKAFSLNKATREKLRRERLNERCVAMTKRFVWFLGECSFFFFLCGERRTRFVTHLRFMNIFRAGLLSWVSYST
jgi:hypothetical protein